MVKMAIRKPKGPNLKSPIGNGIRARIQDRRVHTQAGARGFTLLELLIALAILGVGLTVLLAAFSRGLARSGEDQAEFAARAVASAVLSQTLANPDIAVGESDGTSSGYIWRVTTIPYGTADEQAAWQGRMAEVQVTVTWRESRRTRTIALTSLRMISRADS
jgi:general secretion pathway protein I